MRGRYNGGCGTPQSPREERAGRAAVESQRKRRRMTDRDGTKPLLNSDLGLRNKRLRKQYSYTTVYPLLPR